MVQLSAHIISPDNCQYSKLYHYIIIVFVVGKSIQSVNQESEGDCIGYGTQLVELSV